MCSGKYGSRECLYGISWLWRYNREGFAHLDKVLIFNLLSRRELSKVFEWKEDPDDLSAIGISGIRKLCQVMNKLWNNSQYIAHRMLCL